jgi:hypothetical protein
MYVGFCITAWANVEEYLFRICLKTLNTSEERAAIIYYRTPTLDTRLQLIDELVRTVLPKRTRKSGGHDHPDVIAWNDLKNDIKNELSMRSRIAHNPVSSRRFLPPPKEGEKRSLLHLYSWLEIHVSDAEKLRGRHENTKPLRVDDLTIHGMTVQHLSSRLKDFYENTLSEHTK